jgi:Tol biopolymer transport system component/predicted Ser/Thr protein kinase
MAISDGTRLGPYEIIGKLGAGGMGEVYRARDTRLDRIVALKVSKSEFGERFDREARAVAALNHAHICQLYDVGPNYLVMEYLEGAPLQGPLPIAKAVEYAGQILDALDAAHRKGITHRDLKPANILVTKQGIKLLDFGLAKQAGFGLKESDATVTEALTAQGQILGTLQYMSPEQVQGQAVDARSDIFSFGLVFYEMIAGRRAFDAASSASLIAAVLKDQPSPIGEVRPETPPAIVHLIATCLEKNPEDRWQTARDLRRELLQPTAAILPRSVARRRIPWVGLGLIAAALGLGFAAARWRAVDHALVIDAVPLTTYPGIESEPALSPDGKLVAFTWTGADYGPTKICVKQLDASEPLVLSHGNAWHGSPVWSPDGRQVAFLRAGDQGGELILVPSLGGPERRIGQPFPRYDLEGGMCWLPIANRIVLSGGGLGWVAVDGGEAGNMTDPKGEVDVHPTLSPDGRYLAFVRTLGIAEAPSQILFWRLDDKQLPQGEAKAVTAALQGVGGLAWAPDGGSLIVSALSRGANHLYRVQFPGGKVEPIAGISAAGFLGGGLSISASGRNMALAVAESDTDIWRVAGPGWPESQPRPEPQRLIASTRDDVSPAYSPDGKRIAFESQRTGNQEIWSVDAEGHDAVQLTNFGGPPVGSPRWSPDGSKIAFDSRRVGTGDIFIVSANGGKATRLTADGASHALPAWSSDGRWIYCRSNRTGRSEIWKYPVAGGQGIQVTREGGEAAQHPVGDSWLYWWWNGIWRMPESGGQPEKVLNYDSPSFWAPWREGIVFFGDDFVLGSWRFRDHKASLLQKLPRPESPRFLRRPTMAVSPDGRWVLVTMIALDRGDLMLVENIR